jgi:hypothetical protein
MTTDAVAVETEDVTVTNVATVEARDCHGAIEAAAARVAVEVVFESIPEERWLRA